MRMVLLSLALLAGCSAPHSHLGECIPCAGMVLFYSERAEARSDAKLKQLVDAVGKRLAEVAPVGSER